MPEEKEGVSENHGRWKLRQFRLRSQRSLTGHVVHFYTTSFICAFIFFFFIPMAAFSLSKNLCVTRRRRREKKASLSAVLLTKGNVFATVATPLMSHKHFPLGDISSRWSAEWPSEAADGRSAAKPGEERRNIRRGKRTSVKASEGCRHRRR